MENDRAFIQLKSKWESLRLSSLGQLGLTFIFVKSLSIYQYLKFITSDRTLKRVLSPFWYNDSTRRNIENYSDCCYQTLFFLPLQWEWTGRMNFCLFEANNRTKNLERDFRGPMLVTRKKSFLATIFSLATRDALRKIPLKKTSELNEKY